MNPGAAAILLLATGCAFLPVLGARTVLGRSAAVAAGVMSVVSLVLIYLSAASATGLALVQGMLLLTVWLPLVLGLAAGGVVLIVTKDSPVSTRSRAIAAWVVGIVPLVLLLTYFDLMPDIPPWLPFG